MVGLHIVLLSTEYPPFIWGGIGTFVENLAVALSREGTRVTVISGYPVPNKNQPANIIKNSNPDLEIIRFPYLNMHPKNAIFQMQNLKQLQKTINSINPDVIHGQSLSTFPASTVLRRLAPLVVTFHTSPKAEKTMSIHSLLRGGSFDDLATNIVGYPLWSYISRKELSASRIAVAVSRNLVAELLDEMGETYSGKLREIHNGVDIETLSREYDDVEGDVEESDHTILFAGRLVWRKGVSNLVIFAQMLLKDASDFKLIIHGTGPLFGSIRRELQNSGLANVELKGFSTRAEFMRSMRRSKFVLIPSFYEACPMILLESMCLGKIPVMFSFPYSLEFTENGEYGLIAESLKEMVRKLRTESSSSDLASHSQRVKDFAKRKFDIRKTVRSYCNVYKELCS